MKPIILASSSPRRSELLTKHNIDFIVEYQTIEEVLDESLTLSSRLEKLAYDKGILVAKKHYDSVVISADTMVCLDNQMLGKANTQKEAFAMLKNQSGKTQIVYTAIAIFYQGKVNTYHDTTKVVFKALTTKQIEDYLDTEEWIGKAGAYAIQGIGSCLVESINGDIETVIGLPVRIIEKYLMTSK